MAIYGMVPELDFIFWIVNSFRHISLVGYWSLFFGYLKQTSVTSVTSVTSFICWFLPPVLGGALLQRKRAAPSGS